jgi:hypothetical protein
MLARVPAELAELVKRYAAERGQLPVSELIREGLEWRIGDGDPRGTGMYLSQPIGMSEKVYSSNTEKALGIRVAEELQEIRALLVQQGEQIQALTQALERKVEAGGNRMYSSNTKKAVGAPVVSVAPKVKADKATVEARIRQLRDQGLSLAQIAEQLKAEGVPTTSGRGVWAKGNVERILSGRKTAAK